MKKFLILLLFTFTIKAQSTIEDIPPYIICETSADGYATFLLNSNYGFILQGLDPQLYTVAYFLTQADAQSNSSALPNQFTNTTPNQQIIFVRRWENANPANYAICQFWLMVENAPPQVDYLWPHALCADPVNGVVPAVLTTDLDATLYHFQWFKNNEAIPAAIEDKLTITEPGDYAVMITSNTISACTSYSSATVTVSGMATAAAYTEGSTIIVTATGLGDYEYRLDDGGLQESNIFNDVPVGHHDIYIFDLNGRGTLILNDITVTSTFPNNFAQDAHMYECTTSGNVPATFDLTQNTLTLLNGANPADYTVEFSYWYELGDEHFETIINPTQYAALVSNQVIWARIRKISDPSQYAMVSFTIVTGLQPQPGIVDTITIDDTDGDGMEIVDLTTTTLQITNGEASGILAITYYLTQDDAINGFPNIANPQAYMAGSGTIYFRLSYYGICYTIGSFNINVQPPLGSAENGFETLSYYPNPVKEMLTIDNLHIDHIVLANTMGQIIFQKKVENNSVQLNTAGLQEGVYLLTIKAGAAEKTVKIIKN